MGEFSGRDFNPANWAGVYRPTWVEGALSAEAFAMFFLLFLVFVKMLPPVSMSETTILGVYTSGGRTAYHGPHIREREPARERCPW